MNPPPTPAPAPAPQPGTTTPVTPPDTPVDNPTGGNEERRNLQDEAEVASEDEAEPVMTPNEFVITNVKVDIVYGSAPKAVAEKPYTFNLKTSVQYLGSE